MALLFAKLLLAPAFVVIASLVARRYGPRVAGLVAGLPVVGGPILLVYAIAHGAGFAATAAAGALLGLVSLMGFILTYGHLSARVGWRVCLPLGWAAFLLATIALSAAPSSAVIALAIVGFCLAVAPMLLPRSGEWGASDPLPRFDLPVRAASALVLVLSLTALAGLLGPQLSGLLATFPVMGSILAPFTHAQHGRPALLRLLRGLLGGYLGFGLFCFTVAVSLRPLGIPAAFGLGCVVALVCQGAQLWRHRASRAAEALRAAEPAS